MLRKIPMFLITILIYIWAHLKHQYKLYEYTSTHMIMTSQLIHQAHGCLNLDINLLFVGIPQTSIDLINNHLCRSITEHFIIATGCPIARTIHLALNLTGARILLQRIICVDDNLCNVPMRLQNLNRLAACRCDVL